MHNWCTSAGTDAYVSCTVVVRVKHGIDNEAGHLWHLATVLVSKEQSNSRLYQVAKGGVHRRRENKGGE